MTFVQTYHGKRSEVVWPLRTIKELSKRVKELDAIFGWYSTPISFSTGDTAQWFGASWYRASIIKSFK